MTLFINGNNLNNPFWGTPRVAFELIRALDKLCSQPGKLDPFGDIVLLGRTRDCPISDLKVIKYEYLPAPNLYVWEHIALALRTVGHPLLGMQAGNPIFKRNCATMIHDLQIFTQSSSYSLRAKLEGKLLTPILAKMGRTILTVSEYSAEEISRILAVPRSKIEVVYNGIDHRELREEGVGEVSKLPKLTPRRYVVARSSTRHHKNIRVLFEAFSQPSLADIQLVLFGEDGREAFLATGHSVPPNVIFAGLIGDRDLHDLLQNALCLAAPSLTEGFGLPPLEAMALGTPAVVSDKGATPEVCGDGAIVVAASDAKAWAQAIKNLVTDAALWTDYSKRGLARSALFTWERAGETLYNVLARRHGLKRAA